MIEFRTGIILSITIFVSAVAGSLILGNSIERFRREDRYVSVRGFAEREVKADLAVWTLRLSIASDDLHEGGQFIEAAKVKAVRFLSENGIDSSEIVQKDLQVSDRRAIEYGQPDRESASRYIIVKTLQVRSQDVENVQRVSRMTDELLRAGVVVSSAQDWQGGGLRFMFSGLNAIKPAMLAEATRNAKAAAEEFARESGTTLGGMKKASQGLFTIVDRDEGTVGEGGYGMGTTDLFKKVRVVISVEYSLE